MKFYKTGIDPRVNNNVVLGLGIEALSHIDPNALFFMTYGHMGSIPITPYTRLWDWSQCLLFHEIGINPNYCIYNSLGLIPMFCFSWYWDQSQLQHVQDFGTDPNALFFMRLGSIPITACTWHWDWSQSPFFGPLGLIPMWHLDCAISRFEIIHKI